MVLKIWAPLRQLFAPPWCPKMATSLAIAVCIQGVPEVAHHADFYENTYK